MLDVSQATLELVHSPSNIAKGYHSRLVRLVPLLVTPPKLANGQGTIIDHANRVKWSGNVASRWFRKVPIRAAVGWKGPPLRELILARTVSLVNSSK